MFWRSLVFRISAIVGMILLPISLTNACRCDRRVTRIEKCRRSDFGFIGTPYSAERTVIAGRAYNRFCFNIEHVYKGAKHLGDSCVISAVAEELCGKGFDLGRKYVVNGNIQVFGNKYVGLCGWNECWSEVPFVYMWLMYNFPGFCDN